MIKKTLLPFFVLLSLCSAAQNTYTIENSELILPSAIRFEKGTDKLTPESIETLTIVKNFLTDKPYTSTLRIEGHVAATSDEKQNQQLSAKRSLVVGKWLVDNGVDCNRLLCVGFGSSKPVVNADTPQENEANTRINFVMAALKGRAIGGMPLDGGGKIAGDVCQ